MLLDTCNLPPAHTLSTQVCIIGSGPAGITIAREWIGSGTQVCLLESGGIELDPNVQQLSEGKTIGDPFLSLQATRHRQFGGNSNIWSIKIGNGQMGVRYVPLADIDFEQRDWIPHSGWSITRAQLDPYYARAQSVCNLGKYAYQPEAWETEQVRQFSLDPEQMITQMFQFGRRDTFYSQYRRDLEQAENITICPHSTVVEIEANEAGKAATRVRVINAAGQEFWVEAQAFVLAQGGIENARLLLLSNRQQNTGLGNPYDVVGRYFMDHPLVDAGMVIPNDPRLFDKMRLYDLHQSNGSSIMGHFSLSNQLMQREQLLNIGASLFPRPSDRQFAAINSFKTVAESLAAKKVPADLPKQLPKIAAGIDYVLLASYLAATQKQSLLNGFGRGGWSDIQQNHRRFKQFQVFFFTEQAPDPDNRVKLSDERDALGNPKAELHWRWREIDNRSLLRTQELMAAEMRRSGLGEFRIKPLVNSPAGIAHHIGTTRMHPNPRHGVVDANCRVHGLANLYVAGSSVFPTGGYANPTLTIVALSLRLADHLKQVIN